MAKIYNRLTLAEDMMTPPWKWRRRNDFSQFYYQRLIGRWTLILLVYTLSLANLFSPVICKEPNALVIVEAGENDLLSVEDNSDDKVIIDEDDELDLEEPIHEIFTPSHEWRRIQPGQAIPPGLHVRIDLQTGLKEAKLIDGEESGFPDGNSDDVWYYHNEPPDDTRHLHLSAEEIREALKNMDSDDYQITREDQERVANSFKSLEEIKKDFAALDVAIETETELVVRLIEQYRNISTSTAAKETILLDLEYYVHQVDNAKELINIGGYELLLETLNHTDPELRAGAALVIGSASQNNPPVQIHLLENGAIGILLKIIATDVVSLVSNRGLFALSSLLRNFPFAQHRFVEKGGPATLSSLFTETHPDELRCKAATMITDLVHEQAENLNDRFKTGFDSVQRNAQYKMLPWRVILTEQKWCDHFVQLLSLPDYEVQEKMLLSLLNTVDMCGHVYKSQPVTNMLYDIISNFSSVTVGDDLFEYAVDLRLLTEIVLGKVIGDDIKTEHDEL